MRLRQIVRGATDKLGLEVSRKGKGPRHSMEEVLAYLSEHGHQPVAIVDVGVAYGTPVLYNAFPGAYLLMIEPLVPEFEDGISKWLDERPGDWVRAAAGSKAGKTTIEVHAAPVLSSTHSVGGEPREVPVTTIDAALAASAVPEGPLLIKIDVEGGELKALDGAKKALKRAEVVLLEVALFEFSEGLPMFHEVIAYMAKRGWVAHDFYDGGLRPLDGALGRTDVAFVRRDGPFQADQRYATDEQLRDLTSSWGY